MFYWKSDHEQYKNKTSNSLSNAPDEDEDVDVVVDEYKDLDQTTDKSF